MPISQTPAYNLKVVLKETGIAADTLRAWERRYGLPKPKRTAGGHRLYSQHDIQVIKWLMARQNDGLSISRAVELWLEQAASGQDPLKMEQMESSPPASASLEELRKDWVNACMRYDSREAEQALNLAFGLYPVEQVVLELLQAGLHQMGEGWYQGRVSVQQEHFASGLATRRLEALISAAPSPIRKETLLLACPPAEQHAFPLLVLALLLSRRGWNVVYLGPDVPLSQLDETLQAVQPALVILASQGLVSAESLQQAAAYLAELGVPVAYGGRVFNEVPALRDQMSGQFLSEDIQAVPDRIEQLLEQGFEVRAVNQGSPSSLAQAYEWDQPLIEAAVRRHMQGAPLESSEMTAAVIYLGKTLLAALRLGDLDYLKYDLGWLKGMARGNTRPAEGLHDTLTAYAASVREVMGAEGENIAGWLDAYAGDMAEMNSR